MTRYYIDLKEYAETADINQVCDEALKEVIKDFLLEAQNRALTIPDVVGRSEQLRAFKQFCQENYGIDISHRIIDEFERYGS